MARIILGYQHLRELDRQNKQWDEILKQTLETCRKSVELCKQFHGENCGECK
jgi:hypothetical protein